MCVCVCVCVCVCLMCVANPVSKGFVVLQLFIAGCRGIGHSLANPVQRSYALEWEAVQDAELCTCRPSQRIPSKPLLHPWLFQNEYRFPLQIHKLAVFWWVCVCVW